MRLSVEGYKSLNNRGSINVNGLSIIAGANSSGKSSFMQPYLILKQTIEKNTDGQSLVINGENTNLTESHQLLCKKKDSDEFSIYIEYSENKKRKTLTDESKATFKYNKKLGFIIEESSLKNKKTTLTLNRNMPQKEIDKLVSSLKETDGEFSDLYEKFSSDTFQLNHLIKKDSTFLSLGIENKIFAVERRNLTFGFEFTPNSQLQEFAENLIHIPGIRSIPERQYRLEQYNNKFQGRFDKYTATIIYNWCVSEKDKEQAKLKKLKELISYLDLASNISTKKINEVQVSIEISRFKSTDVDDLVNLSDVGFGLSQVLPILVSLIESNKENIIYIEQPEIHLHPKAQFKLAKIFCDFVKDGKKVIVETHSSIFIRGLQIEVAEGNLSSGLFSLNWFTQDEDGYTNISEATLDKNGAFGDWPSDFDEIYLDAEGRYLDAVENN